MTKASPAFEDYRRRMRDAAWIDVVAEGSNWIAFDEGRIGRRGITIASPDRDGCFGVDIPLSAWKEASDPQASIGAPVVKVFRDRHGAYAEAAAREALEAFG